MQPPDIRLCAVCWQFATELQRPKAAQPKLRSVSSPAHLNLVQVEALVEAYRVKLSEP